MFNLVARTPEMTPSVPNAMEEHEIKSVMHDGWTISIRVTSIDGAGRVSGVAQILRDVVVRCRIVASEAFESQERLAAVLIAKADRWIAAQAGFGPLN
jgi:cysteine synthase